MGDDVAATDAAADLVELGETERVGPLDDERVRLRDVEAGLDDRRRDEHVGVAPDEGEHPVLELPLPQLSVSDEEAELGTELPELLGRLLDRLDAVVQEERLPSPRRLAGERQPEQLLVVLADVRADRPSTLRRRLDHGDVAEPGQRHVEGSRDRRRRQREDVDLEAQLAKELLLRHPEPLLLVDDDEPQILRDDVAREHPVGADEHVDLALARSREGQT